MKGGSKGSSLLWALYVCEMVFFGVNFITSATFPIPSIFGLFDLLACYAVYRDAAKINGRVGSRVINAPLWSIAGFLLFFFIIPLYVLVPRRRALSREIVPRLTAGEDMGVTVKPPIGFGAIIIGFAGACNLVAGFLAVVYTPSFSLGPAYASYHLPPTYPGIALMVIGISLIAIAAGTIYVSRNPGSRLASRPF